MTKTKTPSTPAHMESKMQMISLVLPDNNYKANQRLNSSRFYLKTIRGENFEITYRSMTDRSTDKATNLVFEIMRATHIDGFDGINASVDMALRAFFKTVTTCTVNEIDELPEIKHRDEFDGSTTTLFTELIYAIDSADDLLGDLLTHAIYKSKATMPIAPRPRIPRAKIDAAPAPKTATATRAAKTAAPKQTAPRASKQTAVVMIDMDSLMNEMTARMDSIVINAKK